MPLNPGDHIVDFVDDALHGLLSDEDERYVRRHATACPICAMALREAEQRITLLKNMPTPEPAPALITHVVERVVAAKKAEQQRMSLIQRWTLRAVAAMIFLMVGYHVYLATSSPSPYDLRLLGQQQLLAGARGSIRAQLLKENIPVSGATITLALYNPRDGNTISLASYTTDSAGTGSPQFTLPDWPDGDYTLKAGASIGFHTESLAQTISLRRESRLMLSTDKPIYQPGQTLHARALVLRRPDLKPVAAKEAVFTLTDPRGNIVFKQSGVTSAFGIASADCPLAAEIIQGSYTLLCKVGNTESSNTIEIKNYAIPKFKVALATDKPFYAPGDRVRATVQADYFFNQHVTQGTVALNATAGQRSIASATAITDTSGHATLDFILPTNLIGTAQNAGDARVTLSATVVDSAKQEQIRSLSLAVTTTPIHIELIPESGQLVPDISNRIYVLTTYADGRPAKTRLNITGLNQTLTTSDLGAAMFEITPHSENLTLVAQATDDAGLASTRRIELSIGTTADYLLRTDKAVYKAGETLSLDILGAGIDPVFVDLLRDGQTIHTSTVPIANGRGTFSFDLSPELVGTLQLNAYRYDADAFAVHKTRILYVQPANDLQIHATLDHPEYRPGDTAHLSLRLTDANGKPAPGALSLTAVDEAVFSVLDQTPGLEKTFFNLDQQLLQPLFAIYPSGPDLWTSGDDHALLNQALFARTTTAGIGRGALIARLVEKGYVSSRMLKSLDTELGRRLFREQIESSDLPDSQKAALLDNGSFSLDASTGPANVRAAERLQRQRTELLPIFWCAVIFMTFIAVLFVVARHVVATVLVVTLLTGCLIGILLPSLGKAQKRSNSAVALSSARGIIQALEVDKANSTNSDLQSPIADTSPRIRKFFPETLLWRPELITDDQGNVSLDIPLADSITTWRLSTSAVTASGQLGTAETSIRVFQPFFIDLSPPATLTRHDEISLPVVVYNYLQSPQTVSLALAHDAWFDLLDPETKSLTLSPGEIKSLYFRIRVTSAGNHKIKLSARSSSPAGETTDAVERQVEILPDGYPVESTTSGTLAGEPITVPLIIPADIIENSLHATVKIYPSTFSQLVEGLDSVFQMPSGCFEQTSSTTYPNILALSYLRQTKTVSPVVEATARQYIQLGYQRLLSFEIAGGGFDWFGRPPAHATLTAYGLMEFQDMAAVHSIDSNLIDRTRKWLLDQQQADGSWQPGRAFYHDDPTTRGNATLCTSAYIAWSAFSGNANSPQATAAQRFLRSHTSEAKSNPYTTALVANALLAMDPQDAAARDLLATLESSRQSSPDRKQTHWSPGGSTNTTFYGAGRSAEVETTALAALAMLKAGGHGPTANAALQWIVANKDPRGTWNSTQATVLALKALLAGTGSTAGNNTERRLSLELNGQIIHEFRIPADQSDVLTSLDLTPFILPSIRNDQSPAPQNIRLIPRNGPDVSYQIVSRFHLPGNQPAAPQKALDISVVYDRTQLFLGDQIGAIALVRNLSGQPLPMVMIDLPIPPGFAIDASAFESLQSRGLIEKYQITSRQILVYLRGIEPSAAVSIPYTLRAVLPVKVSAASATAYEYYKPENRASTNAGTLEIIDKQ